jgi:hypothetical protein
MFKRMMIPRDILSIGFDVLDDKYVSSCIILLGNYYSRNSDRIELHRMIRDKDIIPLYRDIISYMRLSYDTNIEKRMSILLYYAILRARMSNRDWNIYSGDYISDKILIAKCSNKSKPRHTDKKICDSDSLINLYPCSLIKNNIDIQGQLMSHMNKKDIDILSSDSDILDLLIQTAKIHIEADNHYHDDMRKSAILLYRLYSLSNEILTDISNYTKKSFDFRDDIDFLFQ